LPEELATFGAGAIVCVGGGSIIGSWVGGGAYKASKTIQSKPPKECRGDDRPCRANIPNVIVLPIL
jgi:hypothetical protein